MAVAPALGADNTASPTGTVMQNSIPIPVSSPASSVDDVLRPGYRHLMQLINYYANDDPSRTYAAIPVDSDDLSRGFRDVSYAQFANAIDHCAHWLSRILSDPVESFEPVAYFGPKDLRYPIMLMALAKLERKMLLIGFTLHRTAQAHLVSTTKCKVVLYAEGFREVVSEIAPLVDGQVHVIEAPSQEAWLTDQKSERYTWDKSWEEAKDLPFMVLHTSGTTGMPKPIIYTHQMMVSFDSTRIMPDAKHESLLDHMKGRRWFSPTPNSHVVEMYVAFQWTAVGGGVAVFGHPTESTSSLIIDALRYGKCQAMIAPPIFYERLVKEPLGLQTLQGLDFIYFGGASMSPQTANRLVSHTRVQAAFGTTESGMFFVRPRGNEDWQWFEFRESNGIEFEHQDGNLFELKVLKKPELKRWQQIFQISQFAGVDVWRSGDLWERHPTRHDAWRLIGRMDDLIGLADAKKLNASTLEMELSQCPGVAGVVVGGSGQVRPFALVEWTDEDVDNEAKLDELWPVVQNWNEKASQHARLQKDSILFTDPGKGLVRNVKSVPVRKPSEQLYAEEIKHLYTA
ncbi:hypothetical protein BDV96DRAFT_650206 [Lophiotrema nucula]|uniref:AMP-dependent synthetase/ligase domain-containing protein n=1 Tax=Lophiotrema nucula TaxID=690887 RepID=A0A6A5YVV8_9PLEO|nr:hypothetical protein BDV96DRAFT_650206 [Lophiotrema nucula]